MPTISDRISKKSSAPRRWRCTNPMNEPSLPTLLIRGPRGSVSEASGFVGWFSWRRVAVVGRRGGRAGGRGAARGCGGRAGRSRGRSRGRRLLGAGGARGARRLLRGRAGPACRRRRARCRGRRGARRRALEPGHDVAGVLEVAGTDAVADLSLGEVGEVGHLDLARLVDAVELDDRHLRLDPLVDRDRVAGGGDVVLLLGPRV